MSPLLKTFLIGASLAGVALVGFFALNTYESHNSCSLQYGVEFPFVKCELRYHKWDNCPQGVACKPTPCPECNTSNGKFQLKKPLILLYPPKDQKVDITLEYTPGFSATFPGYDHEKSGWSVVAHPDGTLWDPQTQQETYGLFWEGNPSTVHFDLSYGFIVRGSEVRDFLYQKLTEIGLNTKEKSDFIMYWYPRLQDYPYVQLTFAGEDYAQQAKLSISPKPDSLLRVFMVAKPLEKQIILPPQVFSPFQRTGFSVVEWGGTLIQ